MGLGQKRSIPGAHEALKDNAVKKLGCVLQDLSDRCWGYENPRRQLDEFQLHQFAVALHISSSANRQDLICRHLAVDSDLTADVDKANSISFQPESDRAPGEGRQCYFRLIVRAIKPPASDV